METTQELTTETAPQIDPKALEKLRKRIQRNNAKFAAMSKPEQRVTIAKDVLKWIRAGKLRPRNGRWVMRDEMDGLFPANAFAPDTTTFDAQEALLADFPTCDACALGGLFVAAVCRGDKLKVNSQHGLFPDFEKIKTYLVKFFVKNDIYMMEYTFEGGNGGVDDFMITSAAAGKCHAFRDRFREENGSIDPKKLLAGIMKNIVKNAGRFRPAKGV